MNREKAPMAEEIHKIMLFMKRRPDISVAAFREYYETRHAPLCERYAAGMKRYIRRYIDPHPHPETGPAGELPFDVITELWFDDEAVFKATLGYITTSIMPDEIIADEKNLFDRTSFRIATAVERESNAAG
jgi:uncharacterized protein (TIGR02118 family)